MIGVIIKQIRISKEMTQEELASKSELSQAMVSQIESEIALPSIKTLSKIAKALNVPLHELLDDDTSKK